MTNNRFYIVLIYVIISITHTFILGFHIDILNKKTKYYDNNTMNVFIQNLSVIIKILLKRENNIYTTFTLKLNLNSKKSHSTFRI